MITKHRKTELVIVAEAALEKALLRDAQAHGVKGWTVAEVRAAGREGVREGRWEADRTIELKLVCDGAAADALAEHVLTQYAPHYAVALHFAEVWVVRQDRF